MVVLILKVFGIIIIVLSLLSSLIYAKLTRSATSQHSYPDTYSLSSVLAGGQYILLTFSNGPHNILTPKVLDILANYSIHATFFVFGQNAISSPEIVKRIVKEGHEIGHQGFYPKKYKHLPSDSSLFYKHINNTTKELQNLTNQPIKYFRLYPGANEDMAKSIHAATGLKSIQWSIDINNLLGKTASQYADVNTIAGEIASKANPGAVILAYDTHPLWIRILPLLLTNLTNQGYEFLTVSQMMLFPDDAPH
jgi:peptidoglycan-N-acetylglucosamine deacetylase